jgi:F-type H+-transporting ATPase subunit b
MQIDWFTFFAQLINFVVLLLLLQRFLYRPIVSTMNAREADLAARFAEAAAQREAAQQEAERFREQRAKLEEQHEQLLAEARQDAEEQRRFMLETARAEVADLSTGWRQAVEREKEAFLEELHHRAGEQIFQTARQVLADLAREDLERRMIQMFLERLQTEAGEELQSALAADAPGAPGVAPEIVVRTACPLAADDQQQIRAVLREILRERADTQAPEPPVEIRFDTAPDLICGVELQLHDYKLSWSVRSYLNAMEQALAETLMDGAMHHDGGESRDSGELSARSL